MCLKPEIPEALKNSVLRPVKTCLSNEKGPLDWRTPWRDMELSAIFYHERGAGSMTNEELAGLARRGDREALLTL